MSVFLDKFEASIGHFNETYAATRQDIKKVLDAEEDETPEADRALEMLDSLDDVLVDLFDVLKNIENRLQKNQL
jgi:glutaredoxin 2